MDRTDIPAPIYAAAGAGEIAYQKLRRLPVVAARAAGGLRQRFAAPDRDRNGVDLARIRESAQRGRAQLVAQAASVQDRAAAGYRRLVARGEQVMADRIGGPTAPSEPAGVEVEVGPVRPAERTTGPAGRTTGPAEPGAGPAEPGAAAKRGGAATSGSDAAKPHGGNAAKPSGGTASGR